MATGALCPRLAGDISNIAAKATARADIVRNENPDEDGNLPRIRMLPMDRSSSF
jgi:hypothetical protein